MVNISLAGCLGLSSSIPVQFTFEMYVAARNREKIHQNPLFWRFEAIQGYQC